MLFDLRGKRKRVVQVIYVGLALLMGVGLVGLGIGGSANGGILDALGIGGGGGGQSASSINQEQIDKANATLETSPKDQPALLKLSRYEFLAGRDTDNVDSQTGQRTQTEASIGHYEKSVDAWQRYLATKPANPDDQVATLAVQAYELTIDPTAPLGDDDLSRLVKTAQIVADARPSFVTFEQLTGYAYIGGDDKAAAAAAKRATELAASDAQRKEIKQVVKQAKQSREAILAQRKQQSQSGTGQLGGGDAGAGSLGDPGAGLLPQGASTLPPSTP